MDWKVMLSSFGLIFLAELGDKTQLATLTMAAQSRSSVPVFIGASAALIMTSLLGVVFGEAITKLVPPHSIRLGAGVAFVLIGGGLLLGRG